MKKSPFTFALCLLFASSVGTALVMFAETIFGMANVFMFCVAVVGIAGIWLIILQTIKRNRA